jgi:2-epi-5-epi-valiolone synthase
MPKPHSLSWVAEGGYDVLFEVGLLRSGAGTSSADVGAESKAAQALSQLVQGRRVLLVTTRTPWVLHGENRLDRFLIESDADVDVVVAPVTEASKSMSAVLGICERAQAHRLGRRDLIIAFGGGVCCDLVSVSAALYRRGVDYVCLPTTLVGQIDAGIGIKGAVNFGGDKSRLGTFHPPTAVFNDPQWLASVAPEAIRSGVAEIVKVAVMRDERLFELLESSGSALIASAFQSPADDAREVLGRAVDGMLAELALDPFERHGYRRRMDFGHTYSPWVEEASGFRLTHGQAVAVDMALFCEMAALAGLLDRRDADRVHQLLDDLGLPLTTRWCQPEGVRAAIAGAIAHRGGALEMPIPTRVGDAVFLADTELLGDPNVASAMTALQTRGLRVG